MIVDRGRNVELFFYTGNNYSNENAYIKQFWEIVSSLSDEQKRKFLRFVTSCSRPPLLGFSVSILLPSFHWRYAEKFKLKNF